MKGWVALGCIVLTACGEVKGDDRICTTPPSSNIAGDWKTCTHRWAYRLAKANEPVAVVAEAVVNACNDVVNHAIDAGPGTKEEKAQYFSATLDFAKQEAHWRIVQARAGNCDIP